MPSVVVELSSELAYGGLAKHMMIRDPSGNRIEFASSAKEIEITAYGLADILNDSIQQMILLLVIKTINNWGRYTSVISL